MFRLCFVWVYIIKRYLPLCYTHTVEIIYNLVGAIDLPDFGDLLDEEN